MVMVRSLPGWQRSVSALPSSKRQASWTRQRSDHQYLVFRRLAMSTHFTYSLPSTPLASGSGQLT
eukprot:6190606-Amphidinium_carterae.1